MPAPAPAVLLAGGRRVEVSDRGLLIGRDDGCDVVLEAGDVSRRHARLVLCDSGGWAVEDLGSSNGTIVDGELVCGERRPIGPSATIEVGSSRLTFVAGEATAVHAAPGAPIDAPPPAERSVDPARPRDGRLVIGRAAGNDLVLDDPNVSRVHAEITVRGTAAELRDLGSRNGTLLDGERVRGRRRLAAGAVIAIGPYRIAWDGEQAVARDDRGRMRLEAHGLSLHAGRRRVLADASLAIEPGELVAVIGRSGSGKTTLVRALAGAVTPDAGEVLLNGEPIAARSTDVGYVPQDEVVHRLLTPREALRYAGRLRLPADVGADGLEADVCDALERLGIDHRADTRIDRLSGGERRRVSLGVELLGRPSVLVLDEPTTGLDPGLERRTMELLRELAGPERSVVVVTHSTASLDLCDRLVVVAPGGVICHDGAPQEALERLGVQRYDDLYDAAERACAAPAEGHAERSPRTRTARRGSAAERPRRRRAHLRTLVARYVRLLARDRRNLAILLVQVPLLAAAIGALYGGDVFARAQRGNPNDAAQVLFLLVTVTIWFGAIAAAREVVKERAVLARERAAGVRLSTYLASKWLVLGTLVCAQTLVLAAIVAAMRPWHATPAEHAKALAILAGTGLAAIGLGLVISCASRSEDQATSWIPLALLPQLLFAGAIVPVSKMGSVLNAVSHVALSRWAYDGLGSALDMPSRIAADAFERHHSPYRHGFFHTGVIETLAILAAFAIAFALLSRPRRAGRA